MSRAEWGVIWAEDHPGLVRTSGPDGDYRTYDDAQWDVTRLSHLNGRVVSREVSDWVDTPLPPEPGALTR